MHLTCIRAVERPRTEARAGAEHVTGVAPRMACTCSSLRLAPRSVADIAAELELQPKDIEDDLRHLLKSVRHTGYRVTITPLRCRHRGFAFHTDKLVKPPFVVSLSNHERSTLRPRQTWISPPLFQIEGPESP